ncbi:hypothetical protein OEZ85_006319 [Tetradesmus obliquus]|uniref:J domain-containing protein n=1 Tax=Tetradesmus obliquus TaxID=3088 RepID=A0ABY8TYZ8_TETOB|nr:hypothetical protein OEZ85_006319 [Tetradesmus obliquus]
MGQVLRQLAELQAGMPEDTYAWRTYSSQVLLKAVKDVAAQLIATSSPADGDARSPADGETRSRATAPAEADWRGCLQLLAECNRPLIEALQLALDSGKNDVATDLLALEQELYVMEYRAKSTQERLQRVQQMQRTLRQRSDRLDRQATAAAVAAEEEACELDGLLTAVDRLKSAVLLARGCDAQAEAQALSSLGHLYKVSAAILNPLLVPRTAAAGAAVADTLPPRSAEERSHDAFMRVLRLFESLPNKISLVMEDWYREARDSVSEYQASKAAAEEKLKEADRAPIREALDAELEALSAAASKGWAELIKHCYSKHPPLNEANRLAPDTVFDADHGKELLKRAILAYHPDKQGASGVELSWKVLAEEITKQLTDKYEYFK